LPHIDKIEGLPSLPRKTIFSAMSAKVMEGRKLSLDSYLHQLVMRPGLLEASSELRTFLELDRARNDEKGTFSFVAMFY
jgi:histidine ammonia-lyase